jgi:release factor glutamine methyltransferase
MNLKEIFKIQTVLKDSGYHDISRIANEIYTYSTQNSIPLDSILNRISKQEPWEYIQGYTEFRRRKFLLSKDTLIPRVESEQLVDIALDLAQREEIVKVIDVGTGSGCLIISIAEECKKKNIEFAGVDINSNALEIAKKNDWTGKIRFEEHDLVSGDDLRNGTLIIANLPYIPTDMYEKLENSVRHFEPRLALDGGKDGLFYYRKLIEIIQNSRKDVFLTIEIEPSSLGDLITHTKDMNLKVIRDFRGKNRFVLFHFS